MSRSGFGLAGKRKRFLVSIIVAIGLSVFGAVVLARNLNQVEASSNNNLGSILPSQMTKLTLSHVYTGSEVDSTINSTQSFTITDKYFIAVQAHSVNENSGWIIATDFANPSSTPAWKKSYNVGHGNATTWNSKTDQIVIADGKTRLFFNADNGNFVKSIDVSTNASGIAYNGAKDQYIQTSGNGTSSGRILDSNFNSLMTFDAGHRLVNQDVAYYGGYIYRIGWGGCDYLREDGDTEDANYCDAYFGEDSNVIYQFDMNGDFVKAFYIEEGFGELEGIDFANGSMYLLFNGKPDYLHYSVYKANLSFRADQEVSFANGSVTKTFKQDETFTNKATTTGNGAITYSSSDTNVASVNSSTGEVTVKGAGTATITATAAATSTYGAASATYTVTINKANRTITFANASVTKTYGDVNFTNVATKTGDGTIVYSSSDTNVASVNSSTGEVTVKGAGTATITATAAATSTYGAASATYTVTINKANRTITFANASVTKTYGDVNFTNVATKTGDGTIVYSSSDTNVASVNSSTGEVTIKSAGVVNITASVAATSNYNATSVSYTLTINKKRSVEPEEIQEIKMGYYTDTLGTIELNTEGLVWKDKNGAIKLGKNAYDVLYTENNDTKNYTTEEFEIMIEGARRTYRIIEGDGRVHIVDTGENEYTGFRIDADYGLFEVGGEVRIDDEPLDEGYYESKEGSTVINIRNDYLETLELGEHTLAVYFNDGGVATATFVLEESIPVPNTSSGAPDTGANTKMEENNSFVMAYILPIVAIGIVATGFVRHRNKGHRKFEF